MKRFIKLVSSILIVLSLLSACSVQPVNVITQNDIDENNGSFVVTYNEDGTIQSLDRDLKELVINTEEDALNAINQYRKLFQIPEHTAFKCVNTQESLTGTTYMFVQTLHDIEIAGTHVNIITNNNVLSAIVMEIDRDIEDITKRRLTDAQIENSVMKKCNSNTHIVHSTKNIIVNGRLMYLVHAVNKNNIFALDDIKVFVDAETKESYTEKQILRTLDTFEYNDTTYLYDENRNVQVVNMRGETTWPLNIAEFGERKLPENLSDISDQLGCTAYQNLVIAYDWYQKKYERDSYDDNGGDILCLVGIDTLNDNAAYWDTLNVFLIGEADRYDRAPAEFLDTMAHEYTHAVFKSINGSCYVRNGETEGISEAYADIFGCLIDGDWIMAEDIKEGKALSDPSNSGIKLVRNRKYPSKYKDENWSQTDGHVNGIILTRIAYQMTQNGFTEDEISDIWYQSMFYGYGDNSTYLTVRHNVEKAARALGYNDKKVTVISDLFTSVGIV